MDKKHHDLVVSRLQENLVYLAKKKCFDEIVVCNRAGELVRSKNNSDEITAAINHEWSRPLTEKEAQDLRRQQSFVYQMLKAEQQKKRLESIKQLLPKCVLFRKANGSTRIYSN